MVVMGIPKISVLEAIHLVRSSHTPRTMATDCRAADSADIEGEREIWGEK